MIYEDIQIKKIILQNCLYEMGKKISLIFNPREFTSRPKEELFAEALNLVFVNSYLDDRISTTNDNIKNLFYLGLIDENEMHRFVDIMMIWLDSIKYYEEEKNKFIEKYGNLIKSDGRFELSKFISNSEELLKKELSIYENFSYKENEITDIVMKVWNSELTDLTSYTADKPYKFLVYATKLSADKAYKQLFYKPLIYASIITDRHTATYESRGYGLVYTPNKENLLYMSKRDNFAVDSSIQADSLHYSVLNNYMWNRQELMQIQYMDRHTSKTYLISQLLSDSYSEITLINNQHSSPSAVFKFNNCNEREEINAKELSEKLHIKLITLNR